MLEARLLESLVPLSSLSALHRQRLADRATLREHAAGETFTNEAEPAGQRLYLLSGSVIVEDGRGLQRRIVAGSEQALQPLAHDQDGLLRLRCLEACRLIVLDAALCDALLTWDQGHPQAPSRRRDDDDWMSRLLVLPLFRQLPPQHLFELMRRFERVTALPGQRIIEQNASGDYFYLLIAGRCSVQRVNPDGRLVVLAELVDGACFGDEALISGEPRNATVTVLEASTLLRLSRHDFQVLLREPLLGSSDPTRKNPRYKSTIKSISYLKYIDISF